MWQPPSADNHTLGTRSSGGKAPRTLRELNPQPSAYNTGWQRTGGGRGRESYVVTQPNPGGGSPQTIRSMRSRPASLRSIPTDLTSLEAQCTFRRRPRPTPVQANADLQTRGVLVAASERKRTGTNCSKNKKNKGEAQHILWGAGYGGTGPAWGRPCQKEGRK